MASKVSIFLLLNLLFFTIVNARSTCGTCRGRNNPSLPAANGRGRAGGGGHREGSRRCPRNALKLGACGNLLGLIGVSIGTPPTIPCCSLLAGLADLEAASCLCTAIRANILGIYLNVPISLSLILNNCGRNPPTGFIC